MFDPPLGALQACIASVRSQSLIDWEWCITDDCSTRDEVSAELEQLALDPRVKLTRRTTNGGIVAATNDAVAVAEGEYLVLLDHDDAFAPGALADVLAALDGSSVPVDYLYTNESHVLVDGREAIPFSKPDWSPERFRASMYTCHISVLRREAVEAVGGFRAGFDGSQDHDLVLRVTERAEQQGHAVLHLPIIGYWWRTVATSVSRADGSVGAAVENGRRAVQEQCDRTGIDAEVVHGPLAGTYRVRRRVSADLPVTVVVPTTFEAAAVRPHRLAVAATLRRLRTDHPGATLVLAHPAHIGPELLELADEACADSPWLRLPVAGPWSLAAAVQRATEAYPADVYACVAPGLVPSADTHDWLQALVGLACSSGAGVVSGLIHDTEMRVLHAGWDVPRYRTHFLEGRVVGSSTTGNDLLIERECTHVSLAASAFAADVWRQHGHGAAGTWDDAGFGLSDQARRAGARNLWTPYARLCREVPIEMTVTPRRG